MSTLNELTKDFLLNLHFPNETDEFHERDKLCFVNAYTQFLNSGKKEDAFSVYFCFSEIFHLFGTGYESIKKLLELLSDHEYHSGELLSKHRDHYSHSVYVFALGLAIYANDISFKQNYLKFYNLEENNESDLNFFKYWGLIALFHDIGYPFQLAHEQIKSYSAEVFGKDNFVAPFVTFGNMENFLKIDENVSEVIKKKLNINETINSINELLAYGVNVREGYPKDIVLQDLYERVHNAKQFMDHGYFSAVLLSKYIFMLNSFDFNWQYLDVLTAIFLHNSYNKFENPERKHPINVNEHPLAYLIILCDELQCWDRFAYGKVSKRDPIAYDISINISNNFYYLKYTYDSYEVYDIYENNECHVKENKNYTKMKSNEFVETIYKFITSDLKLEVATAQKKKEKRSKLYVSDNNFINLCDLAKSIHIAYNQHCKELPIKHINEEFAQLSLEFKMSNIEQAKSYSEKLELINCFYSDKDLDYPVVTDFNKIEYSEFKDNLSYLSRLEHVRWVKEKLAMGWHYGTDYNPDDKMDRNRKKIHRDIVPYDVLPENEKSKDELMINNMLVLLKKFDSKIRIYNFRPGRKPTLNVGGLGHRFIKGDKKVLDGFKKEIKRILNEYRKNYDVVVYSNFAYGSDQLIVECAIELGLAINAILPMDYEDYVNDVKNDTIKNGFSFNQCDELRMRHLLAQTIETTIIIDEKFKYFGASQALINKCDKLILIWDEKEVPLYDAKNKPINRGGTFHTYKSAISNNRLKPEDIHLIKCERYHHK